MAQSEVLKVDIIAKSIILIPAKQLVNAQNKTLKQYILSAFELENLKFVKKNSRLRIADVNRDDPWIAHLDIEPCQDHPFKEKLESLAKQYGDLDKERNTKIFKGNRKKK